MNKRDSNILGGQKMECNTKVESIRQQKIKRKYKEIKINLNTEEINE